MFLLLRRTNEFRQSVLYIILLFSKVIYTLEYVTYHSALAQLVEQMTVNHWVAGSSPASGAKFKKPASNSWFFYARYF